MLQIKKKKQVRTFGTRSFARLTFVFNMPKKSCLCRVLKRILRRCMRGHRKLIKTTILRLFYIHIYIYEILFA